MLWLWMRAPAVGWLGGLILMAAGLCAWTLLETCCTASCCIVHLRREVFKALKPHHVDQCPFVGSWSGLLTVG
jgi:hypothetical protein